MKSKKEKFNNKCYICGSGFKGKDFQIILNGGSLKPQGKKDAYVCDSSFLPFLKLAFNSFPKGKEKGGINSISLAKSENFTLGQFELYFCSFDCIKSWFEKSILQLQINNIDKISNPKNKKKKVTMKASDQKLKNKKFIEAERIRMSKKSKNYKGMSAEKFNKLVSEFDLDKNDMRDIEDGLDNLDG